MKYARWLMGKFPSPLVRRPLRPLSESEVDEIRRGLQELGIDCRNEAHAYNGKR